MINVGVVGLGMMGQTHLEIYATRRDARVVAVSDRREDVLAGKRVAQGNIEGQTSGAADWSAAAKYGDAMELIGDPRVQLVDLCLPTPLHRVYAEAALAAGKHVLVEKPLARTSADAFAIADAADASAGIAMPAMCMRFWPGWTWLKQAIADRRYGRVLSAHFRRLASHPGGAFYSSGEASGGGILDLHVHDTDFVQYLFGVPTAVSSRGYTRYTDAVDHVMTSYDFGDGTLITAEGGWTMAAGYGFTMQYTVNFEEATASFDAGGTPRLRVARGGASEDVPLDDGLGYEHEIAYLLDCITHRRRPQRVTLREAATSIAIVEAEARSVASGRPEKVLLPG